MRVVIAGGGTGGHVFPALVIAQEIVNRDPTSTVLFVGTRRGFEAKLVPSRGFPIEFIEVSPLKGIGWKRRVQSLLRLPRAVRDSSRILRRFGADVVLGMGGYASGPVLLAARLMRKPVVLAEQNAIPGFTNRMLGHFAQVVCVAFEGTGEHFPADKVRLTGNPVRFRTDSSYPNRGPVTPPCVLVLGGSQGAQTLNELAVNALIRICKQGQKVRIVHQAGERGYDATRARYAESRTSAEVHAFIEDMPAAYEACDLVVSRAGATTIAELASAGRPAVLIPFPHAADDHQWHNAISLREGGAALVFRQEALDEVTLANLIKGLLDDAAKRAEMARAMRRLSRPEAAARIVDECTRLALPNRLAVGP